MNKHETQLILTDSDGDNITVIARKRNEAEEPKPGEEYEFVTLKGGEDEGYAVYVSETDLRELVDYIDCAIGY